MSSPEKDPQQTSPKKPYRSPVLEVYGDIRVITGNVGTNGMGDGGGGAMTKTG